MIINIILILFITFNQIRANFTNITDNSPCYFSDCPDNCQSELWSCQPINSELYCVHNDIWNFHYKDILLLIFVFIFVLLSSMTGIGGGGVLLPIYLLVGDMGVDYAIPLTVLTIVSGSLVRMLLLFNRKNPLTNKRYLIDFGILFSIVPFDGNTAFIGYSLNTISSR